MTLRTRLVTVLLLLAASTAPAASADSVFWSFSGVADFVDDGLDLLGGTVSAGTPISGTFSFDSLAVDRFDEPETGSYQNLGQQAVLSLMATFGGHTLIVDPTRKPTPVSSARIDVFDDNPVRYDQWSLKTSGLDATLDGAPVDLWFLDIGSGFSGRDTTILESDRLPTEPPPFPSYRFFLNLGEVQGTATRINGDVSLEVVPEPATSTLIMLGLVAIGVRRRLGSGFRSALGPNR